MSKKPQLKHADRPTRRPAIIGPVSTQPLALMAHLNVSSCRAGGLPEPAGDFYYFDASLMVMARVLELMSQAAKEVRTSGTMPSATMHAITEALRTFGTPQVGGTNDALFDVVPMLGVHFTETGTLIHFDAEAVRLLGVAIQRGGRLWNAARYDKAIGPLQLKRFEAAKRAFLDHMKWLSALGQKPNQHRTA